MAKNDVKIKFLRQLLTVDLGNKNPGDEVTVDPARASGLIRGGYAEGPADFDAAAHARAGTVDGRPAPMRVVAGGPSLRAGGPAPSIGEGEVVHETIPAEPVKKATRAKKAAAEPAPAAAED